MRDRSSPKSGLNGGDPQEPARNGNEKSETRFLERAKSSASGLMKTVNASPSTVTGDLASLHASAGKAEPSSSTSSREEGTVSTSQGPNFVQGREKFRGVDESFKTESTRNRVHAQEAFDHWSTSADYVPEGKVTDRDILESPFSNLQRNEGKMPAGIRSENVNGRRHGKINDSDGAAVVSLLSRGSFDIDAEPLDIWEPTVQSQTTGGESDGLFGQNEQQSTPSLAQPQENQSFTDALRTRKWELIPNLPVPESQRDDLRTELLNADEYVKPWLAIIERYHDEVWGDMLPLAHEARREMKKATESKPKGSENLEVGPAVRRLKMVLQHMNHAEGKD